MPYEYVDMQQVLQPIAEEAFPDNTDVVWEVRAVVSRGEFHCVEAEPHPSTVGYARFRFVLRQADDGSFLDHACFCLDGERWLLLFTSPGTSTDWKQLAFDRDA